MNGSEHTSPSTLAGREWWSVADLARLLELPEQTIYAWRTRGDGPVSYKLGRHVRYRTGDVESWLATRRVVKGVHRLKA